MLLMTEYKKSNTAWEMIKGKLLGKQSINIKLRLMLLESLISSILLYSLHIVPICPNSINKLQQLHSKCTRIITQGYYQSDNPQVRNDIIRQKYNIATVESRLKYFRLETYYKWKGYVSINYLNDEDYIDNELHTLDSYVASLQTDLRKTHKDNNYNTKFKYLHAIRGCSSKQLTEHIKTILIHDNETKISSNNNEYFDKYLQYVLTTESQDKTKNNSTYDDHENIDKYKCVICNIDYKNALNYNKHIRDDDTCSIYYRLEAILPKYCPYKERRDFFKNNSDLQKHMDSHCHLAKMKTNISYWQLRRNRI